MDMQLLDARKHRLKVIHEHTFFTILQVGEPGRENPFNVKSQSWLFMYVHLIVPQNYFKEFHLCISFALIQTCNPLREHKFAVSNLGVIVVHEQALMYLMLMNTVEYLFIDIFCKK